MDGVHPDYSKAERASDAKMINKMVDQVILHGDKMADQSRIEDHYEEQYNPHHDFAIFGAGDPRGGGMQTLQEKMNLADGVEQNDNSSDTDDDKKPYKPYPTPQGSGLAKYEEVAMVSVDIDVEKRATQIGTDRPNSGSNDSSQKQSIPEDQEIHTEEKDEE